MGKNLIFYNKIGFVTLLKREIHRFMKVSVQTILAPLLSNILYLGIFGGMLQTREVGIEGISYLHFLVPGLTTMGAILSAFQNPAFSIIVQKFQNTIQDLNSYPISDIEKSLAFILGGTFRGLLVGTLTYLATAFFVGYTIEYPLFFFISLSVTSFIFASIGLISGLLLDSFEKLNFVLAIVITPLTYIGGVFFEITKLPGILSKIRYINPIYPLVNLTRYTYIGVYEGNLLLQLLAGSIFLIGLFLTAVYIFKKGYGIKID
ncbi:ABC-type polysaccharide/polyol phosphate export systems, permease component [Clostridium aceticum]|uniref:Transport permease protein n=1 Tax=Clostridium aceticum TaxID=84022 RepID=A0A0D8ICM6_9CLOT|nr:ABC transporter permease [Clostridium aceticum]AKL95164.1 ABC-type polysaccharide/polyol phosphate export systems, permease component [Clostridium aceticum]KJF28038.1 ABC transporter [Clostridium aceticum]